MMLRTGTSGILGRMSEKPERRWWQVDPAAWERHKRLEQQAYKVRWKVLLFGTVPLLLTVGYYSEGGFQNDLVGQSCIVAVGVWHVILFCILIREPGDTQ